MREHIDGVWLALVAAEQAMVDVGRKADAYALQRLRYQAESILRTAERETAATGRAPHIVGVIDQP